MIFNVHIVNKHSLNLRHVKSKSGVVENVVLTFEIASQSTTVQKLFPVLVWWPPS